MKKDTKEIGIKLVGIKTEQFAIFKENYRAKKKIGLETQIQFKIDNIQKQIVPFILFDFEEGKKVFLKFMLSCHFIIEEQYWNAFLIENKLILPKEFLSHIAMITIGTARGVLFAKTEGTIFNQFIIPTVNISEMITEDASFEID